VELSPGLLQGNVVRLEPLSRAHVDGLVVAAEEDRSSYGLASVPDGQAAMEGYVLDLVAARERGDVVPYAQVRLSDDAVVGATRLLNLRRWPAGPLFAAEVGGTWLAASAQRSGVNTEAKLLLMSLVFDSWGGSRVDIKTDARNEKARRAITGLGAVPEGVLRQWQPSQATGEDKMLRDTAMFSVVRAEWPAVRARLQERLGSLR
jgi:RimJ/RimL family protein N-acetyltransferase